MDNWNGIGSLLIACVELIFLINLYILAEKKIGLLINFNVTKLVDGIKRYVL